MPIRPQVREIRETSPELFERREVFLTAHALLARYPLPLTVRRHVHSLVESAAAKFDIEQLDERRQIPDGAARDGEGHAASVAMHNDADGNSPLKRVSAYI